MQYYLDSVFLQDGKLNCIGWAVPSKKEYELSYELLENGKSVDFEIYFSVRPDIGFSMLQMPNKENTGIYLRFPYDSAKKYAVRIREMNGNECIKEETMQVSLNGFLLREKVKTTKQSLKKPIRFAKKIRDRITHKPEKKYRMWLDSKRISKEEWQRERNEEMAFMPLFSVLVPLYHTPLSFLKDCVESVLSQSYEKLELCLVNVELSKESTAYITEVLEKDSRVKVLKLSENLGISGNTNQALEMASGDFICLLDHDDTLEKDALYLYAKEINQNPETDMIYSDEDKMTEKGNDYFFPHFKPDFNFDMLRINNYICHFLCVRKEIAVSVGGFSDEMNGAQDYDFILKVVEKSRNIAHVAKILYHWRSSNDSTAKDMSNKEYALLAGKEAIESHFKRMNMAVTTTLAAVPGWYQNHYKLTKEPLVSVLIPNKDHVKDLDICLKSILEKCTYKNIEVLIIENNSTEKETFDYYQAAEEKYPNVHVLYYQGGFNFSAINNLGAREAKGEYLLLLNNDVEVITVDLFEQMLGYCIREDVGVVGAKLLYADNTIQHAGVLVGAGGVAVHLFKGALDTDPCYMCRAISTYDVSCVTAACMMVKKSVYAELGGMEEELAVAFNDVDFCLRVRKAGYLIVYDADAKLYHYESKSRGAENTPEKFMRFSKETEILSKQWGISGSSLDFSYIDPYYNPNLSYVQPFSIF